MDRIEDLRSIPIDDSPSTSTAREVVGELLQPLRLTTHDVPRAEQFAFWHAVNTMSVLTKPEHSDNEGFSVEENTWQFGEFALMRADVAACHYWRTASHIRRDSIDHWMISVATRGSRKVRTGDTTTVMQPDAAFIISLGQAYEIERTDSGWVQLFVPRDAFPQLGEAIDALRYTPLGMPMGMMLRDYIFLVAEHLPSMRMADAPRLARTLRTMIAASIAPSPDRLKAARPQVELVKIAQIKRLIRDNLRSAMLCPERLCRMAGVSRSTLYRLCEPFGGVAKLIQTERLRQAHQMLSDPADLRKIGQISEDVGLFDRSSFGRMFRQTFGCSPLELRMAELSGCLTGTASKTTLTAQPQNLPDLLRAL